VAAVFGSGFAASLASGFTGVAVVTIGSLASAGFSGTVGGVGGVLRGDVGLGAAVAGGGAGVAGVGVACVTAPGVVVDGFDAAVSLGDAFIASRM
jgi:hypothetical protein